MARRTSLTSLEKRQRELALKMKAARAADAKRQREDEARRRAILGSAIFMQLRGDELALRNLIRSVIPPNVKSRDDLALFAKWLENGEPVATALSISPEPASV